MSESSPSLAVNHSRSPLYQRLETAKEIGKRVLLWAFVAGFIAFEWHLLSIEMVQHEGPVRQVILTLLVVLAAGIVEVIFDTRKSVEELSSRLYITSTTELYSLVDCTKDMARRIDEVEPHERVVIDHFGLDMDHAWDDLMDHVLTHRKLQGATLRFLIISPDLAKKAKAAGVIVPDEVEKWCANARESLRKIKASLANENLPIEVEVKSYTVLPTVHGMSVRQPFKVRYISFCHWRGSNYVWGQNHYRIIVDMADPVLKAEADMFQGNFEHLWAVSRPEFSYPPAGGRQAGQPLLKPAQPAHKIK